jgi:hypothetical protein
MSYIVTLAVELAEHPSPYSQLPLWLTLLVVGVSATISFKDLPRRDP